MTACLTRSAGQQASCEFSINAELLQGLLPQSTLNLQGSRFTEYGLGLKRIMLESLHPKRAESAAAKARMQGNQKGYRVHGHGSKVCEHKKKVQGFGLCSCGTCKEL